MYENQTFEAVLERMLERVPAGLDRREGSVIYDALSPAAAELAQMYAELETFLRLSFADTASGEYLGRRTAEFGIVRRPATPALRKAQFSGQGGAPATVPLGARFSGGSMIYTVESLLEAGQYAVRAEAAGVEGNAYHGNLLPITYMDGVEKAVLGEILVPGEAEESDEVLRERYLSAINEQPFGGNIADYRHAIEGLEGVGGVKIFPVWEGGGTVRATLLSSEYGPPSSELVKHVQEAIDPVNVPGQGIGMAPIGHVVTIVGAEPVTIEVETSLILAPDISLGAVQADVEETITAYLLSLRKTWPQDQSLTVRVAQIEARILTVKGIMDVVGTQINGAAANLVLDEEQIPVAGTVMLYE